VPFRDMLWKVRLKLMVRRLKSPSKISIRNRT